MCCSPELTSVLLSLVPGLYLRAKGFAREPQLPFRKRILKMQFKYPHK